MVHVFTSAAINYLPKIRVLCRSVKSYHPEVMVHLALADEAPEWLDVTREPFDNVIRISDLAIPHERAWIFGHTIVELSTAIKPFVFRYLLERSDAEAVIYFDPDIVLFSRLDDLFEELRSGSILLTPHQVKPEESVQAIMDNEIGSLRHGVFNLGFLGVRNDKDGRALSDWWANRVYHFCTESVEENLFVDQKWMNFAPIFFEGVRIVKCPRFNVAPWNITTRKVSGSLKTGFAVEGKPLGFYHFTGFDSGGQRTMAAKYGGDNAAIMELVSWYARQIETDERVERRWAFGVFGNGEPITKAHRLVYRVREDLQRAYPDPFRIEPGTASYLDWFRRRAAVEHPELVSAKGATRPAPPLTYIMPAGSRRIDWNRIRKYIRAAMTDIRQARALVRRAWSILENEGFKSLRYRLYRHDELDLGQPNNVSDI